MVSKLYKIIAKEWRSGRHTVGFIAYETGEDEWCATVGYVPEFIIVNVKVDDGSTLIAQLGGKEEELDAQYIAGWGCKLSPQEAVTMFPYLDIKKYKNYEKQ